MAEEKPFYYPHDIGWTIERDEPEGFCQDVFAEYAVEEYGSDPSGMSGPPENYDPGSSWVFCINPVAFISDDETLTLTEAEMEKIHDHLAQGGHDSGDGDFYDY